MVTLAITVAPSRGIARRAESLGLRSTAWADTRNPSGAGPRTAAAIAQCVNAGADAAASARALIYPGFAWSASAA